MKGADLLTKVGVGVAIGVFLTFLFKGCSDGGDSGTTQRDTVRLPGEPVFVHDTLHEKKFYPVPTGEGSFSFHVETPNGGFDAISDQPLSLSNVIVHSKQRTDTLIITETIHDSLPRLRSGAQITAGISPIFDQALKFGGRVSTRYDGWRLAVGPDIMLVRENGGMLMKKFLFVDVSYCFGQD